MRWQRSALQAGANNLAERLVQHRRVLHRFPELAEAEHQTVSYVERTLETLGVPHRRLLPTAVVGLIRGRGQRTVAVRADMDALPVEEASGREGYRSEVAGVSHACGHDAHTASLLGVAELFAAVEDLPGNVLLLFQPAEEGPGGASPMVAAGALDDPRPDAVLALHVDPHHPSGMIGLRRGPVTASHDHIRLRLRGPGGHAADPHRTPDPIPVAAEIVDASQRIVTRDVDPTQPALITFGSVVGGTRPNVIADTVLLDASVRATSDEVRALLTERLPALARSIAEAHRLGLEVEIAHGYDAGHNDPWLTPIVGAAAERVVGRERVRWEPHPSLGSEDFFAFGDTGVPVTMFRLGVGNAVKGCTAPLHSPEFDLDEDALPVGLAVFAETIYRLLEGDHAERA
ncbi:MAG: M20 metallopeptidase family protein [Egibacteraceae bacterium]